MADRTAEVERHGLNYVMEFDHVVQVHAGGTVTDAPDNLYAPEMTGDSATGIASLDSDDWAMVGWSGQQGGGHVMHNSEYIGGGLERLILKTPGYYVAVYCTWTPEDDADEDEDTVEGWAVAYRESL